MSTEISRVRVINKETFFTKEINLYCLFTEVYCILYAAVFGQVRPRQDEEFVPPL